MEKLLWNRNIKKITEFKIKVYAKAKKKMPKLTMLKHMLDGHNPSIKKY